MPPPKPEVLQGTLDLMVLKSLAALGPLHGYGIARRIEQVSDDTLRLNEGTVYTRCGSKGLCRGAYASAGGGSLHGTPTSNESVTTASEWATLRWVTSRPGRRRSKRY